MKKTIPYFLAFLVMISCQSNPLIEDVVDLPESLLIKGVNFGRFMRDYDSFLDNLKSDQRSTLSNYVDKKLSLKISGKINNPSCSCTPGTNQCSSEGVFNTCCVCCGALGAACGTTFGIASCRCEEVPHQSKVSGVTYNDVIFYPNEFNMFLVFAEDNGIDVMKMRESLIIMVNSAD